MPYTKQELEDIDFYQDFVNGLRNRYLEQIKAYADRKYPFRDDSTMFSGRGGRLYSFEDVITGMGIEDAAITEDSIYKTYLTPEIVGKSTSQQRYKFPAYVKTELLEKTVDRNISELAEYKVGKELPDGVANGMIITNAIADDSRRWLIENNTKRLFVDLGTYYATDYVLTTLKTFKQPIIDKIVTGDPIE